MSLSPWFQKELSVSSLSLFVCLFVSGSMTQVPGTGDIDRSCVLGNLMPGQRIMETQARESETTS